MNIGIPLEVSQQELRVGATPKTVQRLQKQGFTVYIEKGAGIKANYADKEFEAVGANIVPTAKELYKTAAIVLKVLAPTEAEIELMHEGTVTLSYLWPAQNPELLKKLAEKKVNAIAMDAIPRISRAQNLFLIYITTFYI